MINRKYNLINHSITVLVVCWNAFLLLELVGKITVHMVVLVGTKNCTNTALEWIHNKNDIHNQAINGLSVAWLERWAVGTGNDLNPHTRIFL
jgi:hypothetical protein